MNIQEAKQIKIADYLQSLGHRPVKQHGANLWYKSPLREEAEASFKVNTELNQWYDFGIGKGGNIIALASELYRSDNVPYLLECRRGRRETEEYHEEYSRSLRTIRHRSRRLCKLREGCQCGRIYEGSEGYDGTRDSVRIKAIVQLQQKKGEKLKAFHLFSV